MVQRFFLVIVLMAIGFAAPVKADIILEAYYKIFLADMQVGYSVQRYEFDKKKSEFIATSYTKIKTAEKDSSESLKARSDAKLTPLAYEYTLAAIDPKTQEKSFKNIKASIQKSVLKAKVLENKKEYEITKSLPAGTYLDIFLPYAILNSKEGLKLEKHYSYKAIAEETAEVHPGEAYIKSKEDYETIPAFKVLNRYDKDSFISFMTATGDILEVRMPTSQLKLKMVATQAEAVDQFQFSSSNMALLFGSVPVGKVNSLYKKQASNGAKSLEDVLGGDQTTEKATDKATDKDEPQAKVNTKAPPGNLKQSGVKPGTGIMIKTKLPPPAQTPPPQTPPEKPNDEEKNQ